MNMGTRLLTILGAYLAAAIAAMVVLVFAFGWIEGKSLQLDAIGIIAPLFTTGAATGAAFALPVALPTIVFTELTRHHSVWIFLAAGLLTGLIMLMLFGSYSVNDLATLQPFIIHDLLVVCAVTITASATYWLIAWRLYPPAQRSSSTAP